MSTDTRVVAVRVPLTDSEFLEAYAARCRMSLSGAACMLLSQRINEVRRLPDSERDDYKIADALARRDDDG